MTIKQATRLGLILAFGLSACASEGGSLADGSPSQEPSPSVPLPTASPSPSASSAQGPVKRPYTEFSTYESDGRLATSFTVDYPTGFRVVEPDTTRDLGSWGYSFGWDDPTDSAKGAGCQPVVKVELALADPPAHPEDPPRHRTRDVDGQAADYAILRAGDEGFELANENYHGGPGCLALWALASWDYEGVGYDLVLFSTLTSPGNDVDLFDRMLETFRFVA